MIHPFEFEVGGLMKETDKAWLAGIIDGEGSIFVMKQKRKDRTRDTNYILRMTVQSTDPFMAPACQQLVGGPVIYEILDRRGNNSNCLKWEINGRNVSKLLTELLPYLKVKTQQAELAIEFQETTKKHWRHMTDEDYKRQEELYYALKDAKQSLKIGKTLRDAQPRPTN